MEDFPDELLQHIFGFLEDGFTLLDVVPLVCKRWRRVARDPLAWRSVVAHVNMDIEALDLTEESKEEEDIVEVARVIFHAPALRILRLDLITWDPPPPGRLPRLHDRVFSALRRSQAVIREVQVDRPVFRWQLQDLLRVLVRCRKHLRAVRLGDSLDCELHLEGGGSDGEQLTVFGVLLAELHALEELQMICPLRLPLGLSLPGLHLPRLHRLSLSVQFRKRFSLDDPDDEVDPSEILPAHLVRSFAGSLRHLELDVNDVSPSSSETRALSSAALRPALARCASLRSLRVDVRLLTVVRDARQLHELHLEFYSERYPDVLNALRGFKEPLQALRSLVLEFNTEYLEAEDLFVRVARLAANATSLRVTHRPLYIYDVLPTVLEHMPGLQEVSFEEARLPDGVNVYATVLFHVLPRLVRLRNLRRVSGWPVASVERARCEEAIASFRRQRPEVEWDGLVC